MQKFLCCKTLDYAGPMENMTAVLKYALRDPRDKILAVTLSRKTAFETIDPTTTIDLTDKVYTFEDARTGEIMLSSMGQPLPGNPKEGPCVAVDFDLPDGQWTLNVITVSYKGGEKQTEGYLNPLDSAATKVLLDTVYEPIYAHFGEEFGKTLRGFFSDEPRLGNIHGAEDAAIGHNSAMNLPWRDGMENLLAGKLAGTALTDRAAGNIRALLPLLFLRSSDESAHVAQYTYMDLVSQLYSDNFDGVLAAWCHAHHCEHIGHTIEDNNATARLGYGAGHFYRAMAHQDMSGIDVVIQQLLPGMDEGMFKGMHSPGWDGEFLPICWASWGQVWPTWTLPRKAVPCVSCSVPMAGAKATACASGCRTICWCAASISLCRTPSTRHPSRTRTARRISMPTAIIRNIRNSGR